MSRRAIPCLLFVCCCAQLKSAETSPQEAREYLPAPFDLYFQRRVTELSQTDWQKEVTPANWPAVQTSMRQQLQKMLGLDPWPDRKDLHPVITGTVQGDGYVIEKLHFQSLPGLYVSANLYRPVKVDQPLPTILYVCGHSLVVENGVSMGNKTDYQHHGIWFARHGYVCLAIDTIHFGEIRGFHHGTYNLGRWWWPSRGYTPAGVEAWNGIRALDYLETRPEVDRTRFGVTGRSGGGAYSWWIAGLDERIKVAVPVAGIASLANHVIDGAIEGHCDCMYMLNTERWDFDRVAALIAPRALLISNTDKDTIFPLDGVVDVYNRARRHYRKLGKEDQIGLHIAEGPHNDMQPLNIGAFHWFERFLKGAKLMDVIDEPARKIHQPRDLKVFAELPKDEVNTTADEFFVPAYKEGSTALSADEWPKQRDAWLNALRTDCFRAWPKFAGDARATVKGEQAAEGLRLIEAEFVSEEPFRLKIWLVRRDALKIEEIERVVVNVLDEEGWTRFRSAGAAAFPARFPGAQGNSERLSALRQDLLNSKSVFAYIAPRAVGPTGWAELAEKKQTQLRRRLLLLGESLESGQVWDICQAVSALRSLPALAHTPLSMRGEKIMAANALYASLFIPAVTDLDLRALPASHRTGPTYLNVLRHLDLPQAAALAAERSTVALAVENPDRWQSAVALVNTIKPGANRLQLRKE